jgi:hypothetical protein
MIKQIAIFAAGLLAGAILISTLAGDKITRKVHVTKVPLLLYSDAVNSSQTLLPVGTSMYYDTSFDEGFSRYIVYVNVKADIDLTVSSLDIIAPLDGRPIRKEALLRLVKDHPLTRHDLEKILQSDRLSREDIREVLTRFLETDK